MVYKKNMYCKFCGTFEIEEVDSRELAGSYLPFPKDNTKTGYFCNNCHVASWNLDDIKSSPREDTELIKFLRKNLTPKPFEEEVDNYSLCYSFETKRWYSASIKHNIVACKYFFLIPTHVLKYLNFNKVCPEQLKRILKNISW